MISINQLVIQRRGIIVKKILLKIGFVLTTIAVSFRNIVYAAGDDDAAGWDLIEIARKGLFWICLFVSFYGLYLQVFKKDDSGKKTIITCIIVYAASFILPNIFILIQNAFR